VKGKEDPVAERAASALAREMDDALAASGETLPRDSGDSFTLGRPDGLVVPKLGDPDDDLSVHVIKNEKDTGVIGPDIAVRSTPAESEKAKSPQSPFSSKKAPSRSFSSNGGDSNAFAPIAPPLFGTFEERAEDLPVLAHALAAAPARAGAEAHALRPEIRGARQPQAVLPHRQERRGVRGVDQEQNRGETACGWYNKTNAVVEELHRARVWDMEDLDSVAKSHLGCQYYAMRALHKNADLVLCPYNYVFDANIRAALEIDLTGAAVIIDEGHNVEDVCRDGASMEISVKELEDTAAQLGSVAKFLDDANVAARLMRPLKDWVNRSLAESSAKSSSFKRRFNAFGGPVEAAPGEALWKGDDVATAIAKALAPRTFDGTRAGSAPDASAARALARSIVADASRVTAFDGALVREISGNGNTFGLNAVATCHRVCAGLLAALDAPREFAACISSDIQQRG
jgi:hypothetical protein